MARSIRNTFGGLHGIAVLVALAGVGLLVFDWASNRPMWVDEQMLALNARDRGFAQLGGPLWLDQSAPPAWLAVERVVLSTFGTGERAARLPNVLFAASTLLIGVWIGRRWMSPFGAAVLVLLCGIGTWMVFFSLELKHYSSDTLWALLLPALAAWALEAREGRDRFRRIVVWWSAASTGMWFSNGALFVTPLCAAVLVMTTWRLEGRTVAVRATLLSLVWLASFGALYGLSLRHALANPYLQNYWQFAFPPVSTGVTEIGSWLGRQLEPFAVKPGGTGHGILFWLVVVAGVAFAVATRGAFGWLLATAPVSLALLAVFRLVPPFERLALWVVPLLYVAVGFCADASTWFTRRWSSTRRIVPLVLALVTGGAVATVSADIVRRGIIEFRTRGATNNYGLDDRRSVRLLERLLEPGDLVMTTHFGLAGIWWYSGLNIAGPDPAGGRLQDGTPLFEIGDVKEPGECARWDSEMTRVLAAHSRAIVYLAFRLNVLPPDFDSIVLRNLGTRGELVVHQAYVDADRSIVAVFDLRRPPRVSSERLLLPLAPGDASPERTSVPCITITPAHRW